MKILAVGAHLDDIEISCGGTISKALKQGHQVKAIVMSKSSYKHLNGQEGRSADTAVSEGTNALNYLGVTDITIFDFPSNGVFFNEDSVIAIEKIIEEYDPDIIFTHHPFDTHQSHEGTAKATIAAARRKNTILFYEPSWPSGRSYVPFKPQIYVDITDTIEDKLQSIRLHKTEYIKFGEESYIDTVRSRARVRGVDIMKTYAEVFEVLRYELSL